MSYPVVAGPAIDDVTAGRFYVAMGFMLILAVILTVALVFVAYRIVRWLAVSSKKKDLEARPERGASSAHDQRQLMVLVMAGPIVTQQQMNLIYLGVGVVAVLVTGILGYLIWRLAEWIVDFFWSRHESRVDAQE